MDKSARVTKLIKGYKKQDTCVAHSRLHIGQADRWTESTNNCNVRVAQVLHRTSDYIRIMDFNEMPVVESLVL